MRSITLLVVAFLGVALAHKYVRVPGGSYVWSECLYTVPDGSHIIEDHTGTTVVYPNKTVHKLSPCSHPRRYPDIEARDVDLEGWQAWTAFSTPDNSTFTQFLGNFNVPPAPAAHCEDSILYMFTGLQNYNWVPLSENTSGAPKGFDIIQPVLEYDNQGLGCGWIVRSWYVTVDDVVLNSKALRLKPGQNIFGNMTKTGQDSWFIGSLVTESGESSNLQVSKPRLFTQPWAYCTLEIYGVTNCKQLPTSPLYFTNMTLLDANGKSIVPAWQTFTNPSNECKASASVQNPATVTIDF